MDPYKDYKGSDPSICEESQTSETHQGCSGQDEQVLLVEDRKACLLQDLETKVLVTIPAQTLAPTVQYDNEVDTGNPEQDERTQQAAALHNCMVAKQAAIESIQPLPADPATAAGNSGHGTEAWTRASTGEVGAHAVRTSFRQQQQSMSAATLSTQGTNVSDNDDARPANNNDAQASLVEAQLVEEGQVEAHMADSSRADGSQGELVLAEEVKWFSNRIIQMISLLVLAALLVILSVLLTRQNQQAEVQAPASMTHGYDHDHEEHHPAHQHDNLHDGSNSMESTSPESVASSTATAVTTSLVEDTLNATDMEFECFQSATDLYVALDSYYEGDSSSSDVSQRYGWIIGDWCVSELEDFTGAFNFKRNKDKLSVQGKFAAKNFEQDIGDWNMSNAKIMFETFRGVTTLSSNWGIDRWNTSNMVSFESTLMRTVWKEPQLNLSSWDTSRVQSMNQLFRWSSVGRPGISNWDTQNLQDMEMFAANAESFNEDISQWNVQKVTSLHQAFKGAIAFNQDLSAWNLTSAFNLNRVFEDAIAFNPASLDWNTSNVRSMVGIFRNAQAFNAPSLSHWDVSRVTNLRWAFQGASSFRQDLCAWRYLLDPNVTNVEGMFEGTDCPDTSDPVLPHGPFCFPCE